MPFQQGLPLHVKLLPVFVSVSRRSLAKGKKSMPLPNRQLDKRSIKYNGLPNLQHPYSKLWDKVRILKNVKAEGTRTGSRTRWMDKGN
jgi:hypothetical protein